MRRGAWWTFFGVWSVAIVENLLLLVVTGTWRACVFYLFKWLLLLCNRGRRLFWFLLTLLASLFIIVILVLILALLLRIVIICHSSTLLTVGVTVCRLILFRLKNYIRRWHLSDSLNLWLSLLIVWCLYVPQWLFILQGSIAGLFIGWGLGAEDLTWVVVIGLGSGDWLLVVTTAARYYFKVNLLVIYNSGSLCWRLSGGLEITFCEIFNKTLDVCFSSGSAHSIWRLILLLSPHLWCEFSASLLHRIALLLIYLVFICLFRWLWVAVLLTYGCRLLFLNHMRLLLGWLLIEIILYVRFLALEIYLGLHKVCKFPVIDFKTDVKSGNQEGEEGQSHKGACCWLKGGGWSIVSHEG